MTKVFLGNFLTPSLCMHTLAWSNNVMNYLGKVKKVRNGQETFNVIQSKFQTYLISGTHEEN